MQLFGFGKSKSEGDAGGAKADAKAAGPLQFSPEKAQAWFRHAQNAHDTGNPEYACTCWINGLRQDPASLDAVQSFFKSAAEFGKPATKDMQKAAAGKTGVDRYLQALLAWGGDPTDAAAAMACAKSAADLGLKSIGQLLAPKAFDLVVQSKKPRKGDYLEMVNILEAIERFDLATKAGELALKLDPSDGPLAAYVRNLAAQSTMSKGGYENTGKEGGFRSNIRDADKQRTLEEQDRLAKSSQSVERLADIAKAEYDANPSDRVAIKKYAQILVERGTPDDLNTAISILTKAFDELREFAFRQLAGEIRIRRAKRDLKPLQAAAEANPTDETARSALAAAQKSFLELEISEYAARVQAYPTDLTIKFELAKRYFAVEKYNEAIELFQQAKNDGRHKAAALAMLGQSFQRIGWHDEAIETFRVALTDHADVGDATGMELRYGLLCSLQDRSTESRELAGAEEAYKLASAIAVQQMGYRDVRTRRDQLKTLIASLKQTPQA